MFKGSFVALITPFKDTMVDEPAFQSLVEWHIQQGTDGLVPCGTTGESPTLTHAEHMRVTELCIEVARGKVPVVAGTGSNSTEEAIQLTCHAKDAGPDAALVVTPYDHKPPQEGRHFHSTAGHAAAGPPTPRLARRGVCAARWNRAPQAAAAAQRPLPAYLPAVAHYQGVVLPEEIGLGQQVFHEQALVRRVSLGLGREAHRPPVRPA